VYDRLSEEAERKEAQKAASMRERRRAQVLTMMDRSDPDGCWVWTGRLNPQGYGHIGWKGFSQLAHRAVYELLVGPIPAGLQLDHKCRNRVCVRPDHLHAVSSKANNENRSPESSAKSGLRNVYWNNRSRWQVTVRHNGRSYYGGEFKDKADAARAARELRNKLFTNNLADRI
jgi:hypothetical protein